MSLTYIVATYSGDLNSRRNEVEPKLVLQKQLTSLYENVDDNCFLKRIIIVCPEPRHKRLKQYYQEEKWLKLFISKNIIIEFLDYKGDNKDHSYDQWIQGCTLHQDTDYYLMIEDDYLIQPGNKLFFEQLTQEYKKSFPDGVGYLASWATNHKDYGYHAAISNGMISRETIKSLPYDNMLNGYFSVKREFPVYPQVVFSWLFLKNNISIKDFIKIYSSMFWDSVHKKLIQYGNVDGPDIFIPVQSLYTKKPEKQSLQLD